MNPIQSIGSKNVGLIAEAKRKFGEITRANEAEVRAWIHAQLEARGETDAHYTPPAHVRKFEPRDLSGEDGWK